MAEKKAYTNSADLDQTAPEEAVCSGSTLFAFPLSILTLKVPITTAADDILILSYFSEKTSLDFLCESSAQQQTIPMKS